MSILNRITSLRNLMSSEKVDAVVIYTADPHLSEYVPDNWRAIEWISGFTGSSAKVIITLDQAVLWTDSRYFIQALAQLAGTGYTMLKDRQADTISIDQWLIRELQPGSIVAINGLTISAAEANQINENLSANGIQLTISRDLVSQNWINRPVLSATPIQDYPLNFAGQNRSARLEAIRKRLIENRAQATLICKLDDLAWSYNLRGNEISYNPLFTGYGYVDHHQAILFVNDGQISGELADRLDGEQIRIMNYESIWEVLDKDLPQAIYLDPDRTNALAYRFFRERCQVIDGLSIPTRLKAIKNEVEIAGMRAAHRRDGVAMVKFLYWLNHKIGKERLTELSVAEKLRKFRSEQKYFRDESFSPIVAFGPHGAIVHYSAIAESDVEIELDGILLIDSGGQYLDGTTDITRTIATGKVSAKQKTDFTLVLKGMIALAKAEFPQGTKGHSLDILARKYLWNNGLNYGHGTGHGVGHYLSVHEGPVGIRSDYNGEPIQQGQILSDEPGLYREGQYGIRIENVLLCKNGRIGDFGQFLLFETLTLCPIDRKLIKRQLLNDEELNWLNSYHKRVLHALKPHLKGVHLSWLTVQCAPI